MAKDKISEKDQKKAVEIVSERFNIANNFQQRIFNDFSTYYEYYRGYRAKPGGDVWKANIFIPYIKQIVDTILPRLVSSKPKPDVLPREQGDIKDAAIMNKLISYQWEHMKMYEVIKEWVKLALIYGVGVVKIGWDFDKSMDKDSPWVSAVSPYDYFRDPQFGKWEIYKQERDLEDVKANKNYINTDKLENDISSDNDPWKTKELAAVARTQTAATLSQKEGASGAPKTKSNRNKVVIHEYYGKFALDGDEQEKDWFIVIADGRTLLRMTPLEEVYPGGSPFVAFHDDIMPLDFWSIGEVEPLTDMQDELNTLRRQRLDNRNLIINHMWAVDTNSVVDWDNFVSKPGGIVEYQGTPPTPLPVNDTTGASVQEEAIIKQDMDRTSGVFAGMLGQTQAAVGSGSDINTTARGFIASLEQAGTKMQYKLDNLDDSLRELGQKLLKMNAKYVTKDQIVRIVGDQAVEFEKIPADAVKKEYDFSVEGSSTQPQNREIRKVQSRAMLESVTPYANQPLFKYDPETGQPPQPVTLNMEYFLDNTFKENELPNQEKIFIPSPEQLEPPTAQPQEQQPNVETNQFAGQPTGAEQVL